MRISLKILSVYFVIFMLYQTGFVYGVAEGCFPSISLNSTMDYPQFNDQEVLGAKWLVGVRGDELIYADEYRWLLLGSFVWDQVRTFTPDVDQIRKDSYRYLGSLNIEKKEIVIVDVKSTQRGYINSSQIVNNRNKIYANGGAQVYYR